MYNAFNLGGLPALVGIPWGQGAPPESADCFSLAIYAQKVLWGREIDVCALCDPTWNEQTLQRKSREINDVLPKFARRVTEPKEGDMVTMDFWGFTHLATFVDPWHILHITIKRKSRIIRFDRAYKRLATGFWRCK